MTEPAESSVETSEWVDPGPMDPSPWTPRKPSRAFVWAMRGILAALVLIPLVTWATALWGLPDPGVPESLLEFRAYRLPDDDNAALLYRVTADAVGERRLPIALPADWTRVSPQEREFLDESRRAMLVWREGARKEKSAFDASRPELRPLTDPEIATLARLAHLEGLRWENRGEFEEALGWYLALLRFSRHLGQRSSFNRQYQADAVHQVAASRLWPWSDQPNLNLELLKQALEEVKAIEALVAPPTEAILVEMDRVEDALDDPEMLDDRLGLDAFNRPGQTTSGWRKAWSRLSRAFQSEPERSRRVERLIFRNWLAGFAGDRFREGQSGIDFPSTFLFAPAGPETSRLKPASLAARLGATRYAQYLIPNIGSLKTIVVEDERNHRDLVRRLAEAIYRRETGHAPEKPEDLREIEKSPLPGPKGEG